MDIILLSVGETREDRLGLYNKDDSRLSPTGILQAKKWANRFYNIIVDRVIVNPTLRALETESIISRIHGYPSEISKDALGID